MDPEIFKSLNGLITLNIANNQVNMSGPEHNVSNLYNCDKIEHVYLSNNSVTHIYSDWLNEHKKLKELDLSLNHVSETVSNATN